MALTPAQRAQTIAQIIATKRHAIEALDGEMNRLDAQLRQFDDKVASGEDLTDEEVQQKQLINDTLDTLQANARRLELLNLQILDNSAAVAGLSDEITQANRDLTEVQQQIKDLTASLTNLGNFLTGVTGLLTSLTGLLATLA